MAGGRWQVSFVSFSFFFFFFHRSFPHLSISIWATCVCHPSSQFVFDKISSTMAAPLTFVTSEIIGNVFEVPDYFTNVMAIGVGGFGLVW